MTDMFTTKAIIAVVIAGIVGTIANAIVVSAAVSDAPLMPLIFSFGRNAVAIIVALLLPVIFTKMSGAAAWATAIVALTVIPTILAKTVFALGASWGFVLIVNLVYAVVAAAVYVALRRSALAG